MNTLGVHAPGEDGGRLVRLFSYVVASDSGFAPNPFWGYCTLATCKPAIRRTAQIGDWVAGLSPKSSGNRLVYAMQVTDRLPIDAYYADPRFEDKKPDLTQPGRVGRRGDNIYAPGPAPGEFRQLPSLHSSPDGEDPRHKRRDLGGLNVLISDAFWYFGQAGPELPAGLEELKVGRGHRNHFPPTVIDEFLAYLESFPRGVHGRPTKWPAEDSTWRSSHT